MIWLRNDQLQRQSDLEYSIRPCRIILQLIGAWPLERHTSLIIVVLTRLLNVTCYLLFCFILIPGVLRLILIEKTAFRRVKLSGPLWNCLFGACKYTVLLCQGEQIRQCIKLLEEDWNFVDDEKNYMIMRGDAKFGRKLAIYTALFMYVGGLSYRTIMPLSRGTITLPNNVTIRPLGCPSYFVLFNEHLSPAYEIVFTLQVFAGCAVYTVSCSICGLSAILVMHICGQLKVLMRKMNILTDESCKTEGDVRKKLAAVVVHQMRMRNFLKQTEATIQHLCFLEIGCCSLLVCLAGYYIILEWESSEPTAMLTCVIILISFGLNIFVLCYIGELLMEQSEKAGIMSYTINWYKLPNDVARSLVLIIAVSNSSTKITAGKLMDLSLNSFSGILKTSLGYFNILRSVMM